MAISVSRGKMYKLSNGFLVLSSITISSDDKYATGGYALNPEALGLGRIDGVICASTSGYKFVYNAATGKIMALEYPGETAGPATEVSKDSEDLRGAVVSVAAIGK